MYHRLVAVVGLLVATIVNLATVASSGSDPLSDLLKDDEGHPAAVPEKVLNAIQQTPPDEFQDRYWKALLTTVHIVDETIFDSGNAMKKAREAIKRLATDDPIKFLLNPPNVDTDLRLFDSDILGKDKVLGKIFDKYTHPQTLMFLLKLGHCDIRNEHRRNGLIETILFKSIAIYGETGGEIDEIMDVWSTLANYCGPDVVKELAAPYETLADDKGRAFLRAVDEAIMLWDEITAGRDCSKKDPYKQLKAQYRQFLPYARQLYPEAVEKGSRDCIDTVTDLFPPVILASKPEKFWFERTSHHQVYKTLFQLASRITDDGLFDKIFRPSLIKVADAAELMVIAMGRAQLKDIKETDLRKIGQLFTESGVEKDVYLEFLARLYDATHEDGDPSYLECFLPTATLANDAMGLKQNEKVFIAGKNAEKTGYLIWDSKAHKMYAGSVPKKGIVEAFWSQ